MLTNGISDIGQEIAGDKNRGLGIWEWGIRRGGSGEGVGECFGVERGVEGFGEGNFFGVGVFFGEGGGVFFEEKVDVTPAMARVPTSLCKDGEGSRSSRKLF
ncbi:hypothetical protein L6452_01677 [Arctium lappa]|uniref:Uncharacterized protein n=1 Tax=Arctium lappa TaxID=4217 RepID=A0ACB9FHS2_ARCLA|nr:hypothetical protein L6452_01677 [Arctium lappa]